MLEVHSFTFRAALGAKEVASLHEGLDRKLKRLPLVFRPSCKRHSYLKTKNMLFVFRCEVWQSSPDLTP
jgi:hypothetical protein